MYPIIIVLISLTLIIVPLAWFYKKIWSPASHEVDQLEAGYNAEAKILEIQSTGAIANHAPSMRILLQVLHPDKSIYTATIEEVFVPITLLPKLQRGTMVRVKIARDNKNLVALDNVLFIAQKS